jgi:hypothetical protein
MTRWAWLLVLGITLAVWAPLLTYQWVATWDDAVFVLGNPHVREWSWTWMATTQWYGHWMPLTWVSFCANYALFGFHPASWHAVNVGLHASSAVLMYFIARRLVGSVGGAVFAALLFAIHPLRMESVAWISERKDVLVGVFFLGAALLWMQGRRWWSFAAFVAACASKSPAVALPVMLLAFEWWRDRTRLREHGIRLAPFFAVSVIVSVMAFWSLHTILVSIPWSVVGLGPRLLHVAYSEVFYVLQTVWPARLSGLIEYTWVPSWNQPQYPLSVAVLILAALLLWRMRHRWPALIASALAYTVAVFPQAGLFQNGPQLVANRYSYLACLPVALLAGGGVTLLMRRWPRATVLASVSAVGVLIVTTSWALPMWKNGDAMWRYAALHEPACTQCQDMAAAADVRQGDFARAIQRQEQAIRVSTTTMYPRWERHWNLGGLFLLTGHRDAAMRELRIYLALVPATARESETHRDHVKRARETLASLEGKQR